MILRVLCGVRDSSCGYSCDSEPPPPPWTPTTDEGILEIRVQTDFRAQTDLTAGSAYRYASDKFRAFYESFDIKATASELRPSKAWLASFEGARLARSGQSFVMFPYARLNELHQIFFEVELRGSKGSVGRTPGHTCGSSWPNPHACTSVQSTAATLIDYPGTTKFLLTRE